MPKSRDQLLALVATAATPAELLRVADLALEAAYEAASTPAEMQAVMDQLPPGKTQSERERHLRFSRKLQSLRAKAETA